MRYEKRETQRILDESLAAYRNASEEDVKSAVDRVWGKLQRDTDAASKAVSALRTDEPGDSGSSRPLRQSRWPDIVAIAAAIVAAVLLPPRIIQSAPAVVEDAEGVREIYYGEIVRPRGDQGAMLSVAGGPRVEIRSQSEISLERTRDGVRMRVNTGDVIVDAAIQSSANFSVQTKDITASVAGAVLFVKSEDAGSGVGVIGGEVRVRQGASEHSLLPGEQLNTNPLKSSPPLNEELSWSRNAEMHLALLQQSVGTITRPTADVPVPPLRFEVISLRPESENPGARGAPVRCNATDGIFPTPPRAASKIFGDGSSIPKGRCQGRYVTLLTLITTAYGVPERNIAGGPDWVRSMHETFQIEAKAEVPATATRDQLRGMLQEMLADRFKLSVRREMKEGRGYALVLAKTPSTLRESSGEEDLYLEQNGRRNQFNLLRGGEISIKGRSTLKAFADYLSTAPLLSLHRVVDKTGLSGMYEFSLTLNMLAPTAGTRDAGTRGAGDGMPSEPRVEWDPPLARAIEDQLGLQLEVQKVPEEFLQIVHAEKPAEN